MPAYNCQAEFASQVESGLKCQTIRRRRKRQTVSGDTLYIYQGQRTAQCRLLLKTTCKRVRPIQIYRENGRNVIIVDGQVLRFGEAVDFAIKDGFVTLTAFMRFFERLYGLPTEDLELIEW